MQTKQNRIALAVLAALGAVTVTVMAQSPSPTPSAPPKDKGRPHHPPSPLVMALDVNKDGVIDASEIAAAAAELKTLDKNGDGQLTPDEFAPPRPPQDDQGGSGGQDGAPPPPQE